MTRSHLARTWGDGTTTTTSTYLASHTYATAGSRTVVLRVTDNFNRSASTSKTITVG